MTNALKFEKQVYGAVVATIFESDNSIVEVQERNDGTYGLILHTRRNDSDEWDDLTAYLEAKHFDALGSVANRIRAHPPTSECECQRQEVVEKIARARAWHKDLESAIRNRSNPT